MPTLTELKVRITGDASSATAAFAATNAGAKALIEVGGDLSAIMAELQRETALAGASTLEASAAYATTAGSLKGLSEAEKAQVVSAAAARDAALQNAEVHRTLDKMVQQYSRDIALAGRESAAAAAGYEIQRGALQGLTEAEQAHVMAMARMKDASKFLSDMPDKMQKVGRGLTMGVTIPLLAGGAASIKLASDFETVMTKVTGLAGAGAEEVARLSPKVMDLAERTGKSTTELGEGLYFVESMGFRGSKAMDVLGRSAEMSASGMGSVADVARTITAAVHSYGAENLSVARASDVMTATIRNGAIGADEMAGAMGRILPVGAQLKVDMGTLGGVLAAATQTGQDFNEVVTGIRQVLVSFERPSKQMDTALGRVGLTFGEVRKAMSQDFLGTLMLLNKEFAKQPEVFDKLIPNVRALVPVLSLLGENYKNAGKIIKDVGGAVGDQQDVWKLAAKTLGVEMAGSLRAVENAGIKMGNAVAPEVKELSYDVSELADWFKKLSPETDHNIVEFVELAAVVGPVIWGVGKLAGALKYMIELRAAIIAWGAATTASEAGVGAMAVTATGEVGGLMAALAAICATPWIITVAIAGVAGGVGYSIHRDLAEVAASHKAYDAASAKNANEFVRSKGWSSARKLLGSPETLHDGFHTSAHPFGRSDLARATRGAEDDNYAAGERRRFAMDSRSIHSMPKQADLSSLLKGIHAVTGGAGGGRHRGGGGGSARGSSDADKALDQYKTDMYELAKAIALNGSESESAGLKYDIQKNHLDGLSKSLALNKLALTQHKEAQEAAREASGKFSEAMEDQRKRIRTSAALDPKDLAAIDLFGKAFSELSSPLSRQRVEILAHKTAIADDAEAMRKLTDEAKKLKAEIAGDKDLTGFSQYVYDSTGKSFGDLSPAQQKQTKENFNLAGKKGDADYERNRAMATGTIGGVPPAIGLLFGSLMMGMPKIVEMAKTNVNVKNFGDEQANLQKEYDLLGATTEAEKMHYEVAQGIYSGLAPDQKAWLENMAKEIDLWQKNQDAAASMKQETAELAQTISGTLNSAFDDIHKGFKGFTTNLIDGWEKMMLKMSADWISSELSRSIMGGLNGMHGSDAGGRGILPSGGQGTTGGSGVLAPFLQPSAPGHQGGLLSSLVGVGTMVAGLFGHGGGGHANTSNMFGDFSGGAPDWLQPRAAGGDVLAGMPYLVGEERPEIFIPSHSGTIAPGVSAALGGQGGGSSRGGDTYHIHNHMPPGWNGDRRTADQVLRAGFDRASTAHARRK